MRNRLSDIHKQVSLSGFRFLRSTRSPDSQGDALEGADRAGH
jgi:hypothetical protein